MNSEETRLGTQVGGGLSVGKGTEPPAKCMSCGTDSKNRPLLSCLFKGEPKWVCVRCLPMLIHGSE